ncbi:unnamed protein product [Periconia digitata]|uniref:Uncharacterized protein n=1 Tax=Periconia digitata TaxID=1303443 RepID=A0A9W4XQE6_9PLEO|nr:unnamed protein product [Periconia digitata]
MSSSPGGSAQSAKGPPYPPDNASLGGVPTTIPDVVVSVLFLLFFSIFAITHIVILKKNKKREHKFIFNGPLAAFCVIRVITASLRIAWSQHPFSIKLGIVATVCVYAGTILIFVINWFFVQRVIRAQHPRLGWSAAYKVIHVAAIAAVLICLLMVVVGAIQPFLTLDKRIRAIDRRLYLAGQTYFAVFCFAPVVLILFSLALPRHGTDKFGAGRLRNNISILLTATLILSSGSIFRAVIAWLPATPLRDPEGRHIPEPWYFHKACFYTFNFTTELLVVFIYAITRVDLRFHVPNGCTEPGDYKRKSAYSIQLIGDDHKLKRQSSRRHSIRSAGSNLTVEEYEGSLFDDSRTLANSLRFPSTVLEVDRKSGTWKTKKMSRAPSTSSLMQSESSMANSLWDVPTTEQMPPLPNTEWPLRDSQVTVSPRDSQTTFGHKVKQSYRSTSPVGSSRTRRSVTMTTALDRDEVISETFKKLEGTSIELAQPPPVYTRDYTPQRASYDPSLNLNFSFGHGKNPSSSGPIGKRSSAHHRHRHTSSLGSDFTKLVNNDINGSAFSSRPTHVSWAPESSTKGHHQRASASSDLTRGDYYHSSRRPQHLHSSSEPPRRASPDFVIVDRTRYQIVSRPSSYSARPSSYSTRPRTPLHFPAYSSSSLPAPGRSVPNFQTEAMEIPTFELGEAPSRSRSLSESDKGSDGRSSNRVVE